MSYEVRPLKREDIARVNAIDREAYPNWWPPSNYESELTNNLAHYLVIQETDGRQAPHAIAPGTPRQSRLRRLTGCIRGLLRREGTPPPPPPVIGFTGFWIMSGEAHITTIAVHQNHRGCGAGELLLISAIEMAIQLEATVMTLEVRISNTAAQQLYEKYQFNRVGLRHAYYTNNREDALIMTTEVLSSESFRAHLEKMKQTWSARNTLPRAAR